jgi:type 1 glutamine amidotransferase
MIAVIKRCLVLCLLALSCSVAVGREKPKTKILFIGKAPDHPYGSHMYMHTCAMLAKCVELTPGIETVVSNGWPTDVKAVEGVKAIVVYTNPAAEILLEGPHRSQVDDLMKKGVGLVAIHWASSIEKGNLDRLGPTWFRYLGGTWVSHGGLSGGKSPLKQLLPDHPICRGWKEYEIEDEYYLDPIIKQAKPLLQVTERKGKNVIVGWVFERPDGGRAFGTTLGHPYKNFQIEAFRRMLVNGILWSAHRDVPKDGAPVNLRAEELALPPEPAKAPFDAKQAKDHQGAWDKGPLPIAEHPTIELVAGGGKAVEGKPATECKLSQPFGIAFDIGGSKVIQHWGGKEVQAVLKDGVVDVLTTTPIYLPDPGIEKFAQLGLEHNPNFRLTMMEFWLPCDQYEPRHYSHGPKDSPTEHIKPPKNVDHNAATADGLRRLHKRYFDEMDDLVLAVNKNLGKPVVFVVPVGQAVIALREKIIAGKAPGLPLCRDLLQKPGRVAGPEGIGESKGRGSAEPSAARTGLGCRCSASAQRSYAKVNDFF